MKKFLVNIILFFSIIATTDLVFGLFCNFLIENTHSGETARSVGVLKKNTYDIMIMGSSRCVCHYDDNLMVDSLGLKVINAGEKGNGIVLMYGRYHIIPKEHKPRVLIYDVEPCFDDLQYEEDDNNTRYLSGLKYFYNEPGISDIFKSIGLNQSIKMQSNLYRYNSDLFVLVRDYGLKTNVNMSSYKPSYNDYVEVRGERIERNIDSLKLYYFEKLIKDTKADGVNLIVVASPKYEAYTKDELSPIFLLCQKYNVPIWDYYLDMQEKRWFCDNMHLNFNGSQVFTNVVIKRIETDILNDQLIN